jgi:hypothetical protein
MRQILGFDSWLYCRREFGYQAARGVTLAPHLTLREPV